MATTEELLAQILAGQEQINDRLDALESGKRGGTPKPDHVPEPDAHYNGYGWDAMDEDQRQAWIRAHEGLIMEAEREPETAQVDVGGVMVAELPVPPESIKAEWAESAKSIFANLPKDWPIDEATAADAYAKGGPLWLAAFGQEGHDWIMLLPYPLRQRMVEQVARYAPGDATRLGRDILRQSAEASQSWAHQDALRVADNRLDGIVRGRGTGA